MRWTVIFIVFLFACNEESETSTDVNSVNTTPERIEFDTYNQKISYCIGLDHARGCYQAYNSKQVADQFDMAEIRLGMCDYLLGEQLRISFLLKDSLLDLYLLPNGTTNPDAVSKKDASYLIGLEEAFTLVSALVGRKIDQTIDVEYLTKGVNEGFGDDSPTIPFMDAKREIDKYFADLNEENGALFLEENLLFEGVVETESGLQYEIIQEGTGKVPNLADSVIIHYTGRFIDGRVFESTIPSNIPFKGPLMGVISGWQEGVMMMKEGGQRRLYIPHHLAYGEEGKGVIEPNSTLIFDIELLKVIRFQ